MSNYYFTRAIEGRKPFTKEEIEQLLSDDFEIIDVILADDGLVDQLILKSVKYPELLNLDPISHGIALHRTEEDGYYIDPDLYAEHEIFLTHVVPDLMTDLELEYDEDYFEA